MLILLIVLGSLCLLYFFFIHILFSHGTNFYFIWMFLGVVALLSALFLRGGCWEYLPDTFQVGVRFLLTVGVVLILITQLCICGSFLEKGEAGLDYLIVLGAQMKRNGPSRALQYRLEKAYAYFRENPDTILIVSGGQGANEHISEAQGMYDYLIRCGVPDKQIIKEDQSVNTVQNLTFSAAHLDRKKAHVGIVTNNFHVFRSVQIAKKIDYKNVCGIAARSEPLLQCSNMLRETLSVVKDFLAGNM
ncbi:MAG: YdcF family protein [Lachnospiraceae bacterium]